MLPSTLVENGRVVVRKSPLCISHYSRQQRLRGSHLCHSWLLEIESEREGPLLYMVQVECKVKVYSDYATLTPFLADK